MVYGFLFWNGISLVGDLVNEYEEELFQIIFGISQDTLLHFNCVFPKIETKDLEYLNKQKNKRSYDLPLSFASELKDILRKECEHCWDI